jgi:hypothetical protein
MRMRVSISIVAVALGLLTHVGPALAQAPGVSDAECQRLRQRLGEHAQLSDGVRKAIAAQATATPATSAGAPAAAPAPASRGDVIRARLEQIPKERQVLEDQRLAAMVKLDLSRAGQAQTQIQALDAEKVTLERELTSLPAGTAATPTASAAQVPVSDVARIRCQDMAAAVDNAVKTRRRELGAREDQAGAIPLVPLKSLTADQIAPELAAQFSPGAAASTQVGLFDPNGDARLDGVVDVPVVGVFRLFRQKPDGTVGVEVFPTSTTPGYAEMTRRLDETTLRQTGQALADVLATRPAGPPRAVTQTADFAATYAQLQAGNFADAAKLGAAAARSMEFPNVRGQAVRMIEIIDPVAGGVSVRRTVVMAQANDQEVWDETTTVLRPTSPWRTDVEVARTRQLRTTAGGSVGTPTVSAPSKFTLER